MPEDEYDSRLFFMRAISDSSMPIDRSVNMVYAMGKLPLAENKEKGESDW